MARTSFDIVVLSSSPPAHDLYAPSSPLNGSPRRSPRRVAMSPSPILAPSPPTGLQRRTSGASTLVSRKAPIPPEAIRGFATVGSLVRSEHFAQQLDEELEEPKPVRSRSRPLREAGEVLATKEPRKSSIETPVPDANAKSKPKPRARKRTTDKANAPHDPELRLPAPKISPYFTDQALEALNDPPIELADTASKSAKPAKPRKPRTKKEQVKDGDITTAPKKAKTAKARRAANATTKSQSEDACVKSAHFRKDVDKESNPATVHMADGQSTEADSASTKEVPLSPQVKKRRSSKQRPPKPLVVEALDLDEAVSRRRDWTPPRDTSIASPFTDSCGKENKPIEPDNNNANFTHMISNFTFAQSPSVHVTATTAANASIKTKAATKRRRVELVNIPANQAPSRDSSPEKGKAPKKKARTITDIATEQYQTHNVTPNPAEVTSEFCQSRPTVIKVPLNDVTAPDCETPPKKPVRKRSKSKTDSKKTNPELKSKKASSKSSAKSKPMAEKLLSPESALMRLGRQDMLFGTSSQLALEESPSMVRQLQLALKESEEEADRSLDQPLAPPRYWPRLEKTVGKRSLWNASSRDGQGGLLENEEDIYIPAPDRTQDLPLLMDGANDQEAAASSFLDIDDIESAPVVIISSDRPTPPSTIHQIPQAMPGANEQAAEDVSKEVAFEDIDDFYSLPPPSNQNAESHNSFTDIDEVLLPSLPSTTSSPQKPKPPELSSAGAANQVINHRCRPPNPQSLKPRKGTLLASPTTSTVKEATLKKSASAPPATPSRASGRFIDIDEILDSEDEVMAALSPTPPRLRKVQDSEPLTLYTETSSEKPSPKIALGDSSLTPIYRIPTPHLTWEAIKPHIFPLITSHIRSLPPATNPKKPSWHEKMLMYDPIVLEDFTTYLNTTTKIRTYKRATKVQIKAWNKSMKTTGNEEIGVLEWEDVVLGVEKDLETWQVQAWCESMSVCCIWGEGKNRGGVRKSLY